MNGQVPVVVQHRWKYQPTSLRNGELPGDGIIHFVWVHSSEQIAFRNEINLTELSSTVRNGHQRNEDDVVTFYFEAPISRPIRAGAWKLRLVSDFRKKSSSFVFIGAKSRNRFAPNNLKDLNLKGSNFKDSNLKGSKEGVRKSTSSNKLSSTIGLGEILNDMNYGEVQSRVVAETRFLIVDSSKSEVQLEAELKQFWTVEDVCLHDQEETGMVWPLDVRKFKSCLNTTWSVSLPDPKSECC